MPAGNTTSTRSGQKAQTSRRTGRTRSRARLRASRDRRDGQHHRAHGRRGRRARDRRYVVLVGSVLERRHGRGSSGRSWRSSYGRRVSRAPVRLSVLGRPRRRGPGSNRSVHVDRRRHLRQPGSARDLPVEEGRPDQLHAARQRKGDGLELRTADSRAGVGQIREIPHDSGADPVRERAAGLRPCGLPTVRHPHCAPRFRCAAARAPAPASPRRIRSTRSSCTQRPTRRSPVAGP